MTILIIGVVVLAVVIGLMSSNTKDDCCGVSIEEQNHCNVECKSSPYKK